MLKRWKTTEEWEPAKIHFKSIKEQMQNTRKLLIGDILYNYILHNIGLEEMWNKGGNNNLHTMRIINIKNEKAKGPR